MAHVVGVPKRDPCQKCSMPVFLAERLAIGKYVYHRICLKCARCDSQLTPGSFYETETDGEYCCETCPDEEKSLDLRPSSLLKNDAKNTPRNRGSIAERLAFFENDGKQLLQKSLSDEEKTQSLKKLSQVPSTVYKPSSALSNFMNTHLSDKVDASITSSSLSEDTSKKSSRSASVYSDSDMDDDEDAEEGQDDNISEDTEKPPELPKSEPPSILNMSSKEFSQETPYNVSFVHATIAAQEESKPCSTDNEKTHYTEELVTALNNKKEKENPLVNKFIQNDNEETIIMKKIEVEHLILNTAKFATKADGTVDSGNDTATEISRNINTNKSILEELPISHTNKSDTNNYTDIDTPNISLNVTKDKTETDEQMRTTNTREETLNINSNVNTNDGNTETNNELKDDGIPEENAEVCILDDKRSSEKSPSLRPQTETVQESNRSSMVRARLHQFEKISNDISATSVRNGSTCNVSNSNISSSNSNRISIKNVNSSSNNNSDSSNNINTNNINSNSIEKTMSITAERHIMQETEVPKSVSNENVNREQNSTPNDSYTLNDENVSENASSQNIDENDENCTNHKEAKIIEDSNIDDIGKDSETNKCDVEKMEIDTQIQDFKSEQNENQDNQASTEKEKPLVKVVPVPLIRNNTDQPVDEKTSTLITEKTDSTIEYPDDLNPFQSDDEEDKNDQLSPVDSFEKTKTLTAKDKSKSLNPFDSSDDEVDEQQSSSQSKNKTKPPRPPPPKKVSTNPFGSESEDDEDINTTNPINNNGTPKKTPIPTPRNYISASKNSTPEPTPRLSRQTFGGTPEHHGSNLSLSTPASSIRSVSDHFNRDSDIRSSTNSLASSGSASGTRHRKNKKAPAPPPPPVAVAQSTPVLSEPIQSKSTPTQAAKELFPSSDQDSKKSSPNSSRTGTPQPRKKRPAPAPPKVDMPSCAAPLSDATKSSPQRDTISADIVTEESGTQYGKNNDENKSIFSELPKDESSTNATATTPIAVCEISLDDESITSSTSNTSTATTPPKPGTTTPPAILKPVTTKRRLIALDASLIEDSQSTGESRPKEEENVVYRRTIAPLSLDSPLIQENLSYSSSLATETESHNRQLEKLKDNKEAKNRNRQSQVSLNSPNEENDPLFNKSIQGKWKRRKGPAPALPVPPKKVLQMLPLQEIRLELDLIETQQQGLEKQGVMLEKMIRERCEGSETENEPKDTNVSSTPNTKEVEDLILQLFELVNEKNDLFRRQAELMYLRRQHRLEQEQADLEYEIRVLMAQPECNKTDSDKAREETLISRLVEVVQLRNEVIDRLEMDRLREAEEDMSIKQSLELHTAKREEELIKQTPTKLSKKEKKKQKELKKLGKSKKMDADKDADESELKVDNQKCKKKKKKFLF